MTRYSGPRYSGLWVVDTNVVVAGLLSRDKHSPPAQILDAMLERAMGYLLCVELLSEYRAVLLRKKIRTRHGLDEAAVDQLLEALVKPAVVVDISGRTETAPDRGDNHLWRLLAARQDASLITGDTLLINNPPPGTRILSPTDFCTLC